jgi:hypothetical protein
MENNEMSGDCCTYGTEETCIQGFGGGELREEDLLEDLRLDGH